MDLSTNLNNLIGKALVLSAVIIKTNIVPIQWEVQPPSYTLPRPNYTLAIEFHPVTNEIAWKTNYSYQFIFTNKLGVGTNTSLVIDAAKNYSIGFRIGYETTTTNK